MCNGAIRRAETVLAEKYTSPYGDRNPEWDIDRPDGPDNRYHIERLMAERVENPPHVVSAESISFVSIAELVQTLAEAGLINDCADCA